MVPKESSVWSFLVPKVSCPRRINLLAHGTSVYNISVTELYFLDLLTLGGYNEAIRGILYLQWIFFYKHSFLCLLDQYWVGGEGKRPGLESYLATVGKQMTCTN